jgi:hypothetical protein
MLEGFSPGSYGRRSAEGGPMVDSSRRLFREGKAQISREVAEIFERIGTTAETWKARLEKSSESRLLSRFPDRIGIFRPDGIETFGLAASPGAPRPREVTQRLGLRRAVNLASCLVTGGRHEACTTTISTTGR